MNEDQSFTGNCPTCGQPYLQRERDELLELLRVLASPEAFDHLMSVNRERS